jgi:hypothetical protein
MYVVPLIVALKCAYKVVKLDEPLQEGEYVIMKDDPNAEDWYCAEIRKILADRIEVNYYTNDRNTGINKLSGINRE